MEKQSEYINRGVLKNNIDTLNFRSPLMNFQHNLEADARLWKNYITVQYIFLLFIVTNIVSKSDCHDEYVASRDISM